MDYILVAVGGAAGSFARFSIGKKIAEKAKNNNFLAIFIINIMGAISLGIVCSIGLNDKAYILLADGFLGAYTTFSTFMYEGFHYFKNEKLNAVIYILGSIILGIVGFVLGIEIIKLI